MTGRLSDEQLRRQGRADAVVMLVLRSVNGTTMTAEDWGDLVEVSAAEIRAALDRMRDAHRQRTAPKPAVPKRTLDMPIVACPVDGCSWTGKRLDRHALSHRPPVACPNGCGRTMPEHGLGRHLPVCEGATSA